MRRSSPPHPLSAVSILAKNKLRRPSRLGWKTIVLLLLSVALSLSRLTWAQGEADATPKEESSTPFAPTASWVPAADIPSTAVRYGFAQNGEDFYVISGSDETTISSSRLLRYNATTNVWTPLANIPVGSNAPAAAYFAGKIYVAGGFGTNAFQIYDIATNTWSAGPPRPGIPSSFGAAAGAFNGNVYFVGGHTSTATLLSIYNIASNTWSTGPGAPSPFQLGGYHQAGQFLYMVGSFAGGTSNSTVSKRLNMATNTWSTGPVWTPQRAELGLVAAGSKLFAIGGDLNGPNLVGSTEVYELETSAWPSGTWTPSPDALPSPRWGNHAGFFSSGRSGGEIWSTGGSPDDSTANNLNEHLFRPVPPCPDYTITQSTRPLVPATTNIGNFCNDCVTSVSFPFPVSFYGNVYTGAVVTSNGTLQFGANINEGPNNTSLPATAFLNPTIFPFWDDLRTDGAGNGIFTSVTGSAPNRVFTIEWRVSRFGVAGTTNFEIRFFEASPEFEIVYGATTGSGYSGTIGVQRDATTFTQFAGPNAAPPAAGTRLIFSTGCCAPIAFNGAIGSGSDTYPGTSGTQTGRLFRENPPSACGTAKPVPAIVGSNLRTYDAYSFTNSGPATCMKFSVNTSCVDTDEVFFAAYLGSFDAANITANYLGDPGLIQPGFNEFSVNVPANSTVVLVVHALQPGGACPSYDVVATGLCPLELTGAFSRKTHGAQGNFDIPLPLIGQPGVECRSTGGNHTLVFTFNSVVTGGAAAMTAGIGTAGSPSFSGTTMTVPLSGVADLQKITLTLSSVTNGLSQVLPPTAVSMNVLLGDTNGNLSVNATDIGQTKANSGFPPSATRFRTDTNASGSINATDIGQVKANAGHSLP